MPREIIWTICHGFWPFHQGLLIIIFKTTVYKLHVDAINRLPRRWGEGGGEGFAPSVSQQDISYNDTTRGLVINLCF